MACNCYYCMRGRKITAAIRERNTDTLITLLKELSNRMIMAEFDVEYFRSIFDGSWPSSIEILEKALLKAKGCSGTDTDCAPKRGDK